METQAEFFGQVQEGNIPYVFNGPSISCHSHSRSQGQGELPGAVQLGTVYVLPVYRAETTVSAQRWMG